MRLGRLLILLSLACWIAWPAHAGTRQTCKEYLAKYHEALGIFPRVMGLDRFVADPDDDALRTTAANMLGPQDTERLRSLMEHIEAAWETRDACTGDVGDKIKADGAAVNPAEYVAYVEALHDHGLPLLSQVVEGRAAGARALAERARIESELGGLSAEWGEAVPDLAAGRADGSTDPAAVERLRAALAGAETPGGRCLLRAYLLRVRPLGDDFVDEVRAFEPCLDLPKDATPSSIDTSIRDQGFLGAVQSRNRALEAGQAGRAIREWTALLEVFGGERGGAWSDPANEGVPEEVRTMEAAAAGREWPTRSRIELGLYCLSRHDAACVERQFAGPDGGLSVTEHLLASIADGLGEDDNPLAVDLWAFLEQHGTQGTRYFEKRMMFRVAHGTRAEVRNEIAAMIAAGECGRATRVLSEVSSAGWDPLVNADALLPCTEDGDREAVQLAWRLIGDAYLDRLRNHMQADPPRIREAVALARKALAIPEAYRHPTVTDYALYVLEVAEQRRGAIDTAAVRRDRLDACTQTLGMIAWKRRTEDPSYVDDLKSLRRDCCSFLRDNRKEWVAWMKSDPEAIDHRGRTVRRQFSPEEIANKQDALERFCSKR